MATDIGLDKLTAKDIEEWIKSELNPPPLEVEVGFLQSATYAGVDTYKNDPIDKQDENEQKWVAEVAYNNNYGNGVPARPFFTAVVEKEAESEKYWDLLEVAYDNGMPFYQAMELIGTEMKQDIQRSIIDWKTPPNSPATIKRKGSSNPLVDTGHMGDSVSYELKYNKD